jgi:hypothetical protein
LSFVTTIFEENNFSHVNTLGVDRESARAWVLVRKILGGQTSLVIKGNKVEARWTWGCQADHRRMRKESKYKLSVPALPKPTLATGPGTEVVTLEAQSFLHLTTPKVY